MKKTHPRDTSQLAASLYKCGRIDVTLHKSFESVGSRIIECERESIRMLDWKEILNYYGEEYYNDRGTFMDPIPSVEWIERILDFNRINKKDFLEAVASVMDRSAPKINTLLFKGPPNAGKTLIGSSICESLVSMCNLSKISGKSTFEFSPMIGVRCCLINEPSLSDETVELAKNLFEGIRVSIEVKYRTPQSVDRTPIIVCTNSPLAFLTRHREVNERALLARCRVFEFHEFSELKDCPAQIHPYAWKLLLE